MENRTFSNSAIEDVGFVRSDGSGSCDGNLYTICRKEVRLWRWRPCLFIPSCIAIRYFMNNRAKNERPSTDHNYEHHLRENLMKGQVLQG